MSDVKMRPLNAFESLVLQILVFIMRYSCSGDSTTTRLELDDEAFRLMRSIEAVPEENP